MKNNSKLKNVSYLFFKKIIRDERGVGAVEFALILPLLLALYISAFELTIAFSIYKRVTHAAGTVSNLVSQENTVSKSYLQQMPFTAGAILLPYQNRDIKMKISGIAIDANGNGKVAWSWDEKNSRPWATNSPFNVPVGFKTSGEFIIRTEVTVPHSLLQFMTTLEKRISLINISHVSYFPKRGDAAITCSNC